MPLESSPESPQPLRVVSQGVAKWIRQLGEIWAEGQVTQLNRRAGNLLFLRLRDLQENVSVSVVTDPAVIDHIDPPIGAGSRIVVLTKPEFWSGRGEIQFRAREIRSVGIGDLLARVEGLRKQLEAEGLFRPELKRPLPFLPRVVGLVCGRESAAERDVVENACRRWPAVRFEIREVVVQGPRAAPEVAAAMADLETCPEVDVIIVTRGGGSIEDLLPFSEEELVRAVSQCRIPVISAVGHEQDRPLIDLAADVRASTPTDAARRVVPDLREETALIDDLHVRANRSVDRLIEVEIRVLAGLLARPALAEPGSFIDALEADLTQMAKRSSRELASILSGVSERLYHDRARLRAVSPQATLERGYAVVSTASSTGGSTGTVVRDAADLEPGQRLAIRVARGRFGATVSQIEPEEAT